MRTRRNSLNVTIAASLLTLPFAGCWTPPPPNPQVQASAWYSNSQSFLVLSSTYEDGKNHTTVIWWSADGKVSNSHDAGYFPIWPQSQPAFYRDSNHFLGNYGYDVVSTNLNNGGYTSLISGKYLRSALPSGSMVLTEDSASMMNWGPFHTFSVMDLRGTTARTVLSYRTALVGGYSYNAFMLADDRWGINLFDSNDNPHFALFDTTGTILFTSPPLTQPTMAAVYLRQSRTLVISGYGYVTSFNLATGAAKNYPTVSQYSLNDLLAPTDGRYFAIAGQGTVKLVNPVTEAETDLPIQFYQFRLAPDGTRAAIIKSYQDAGVSPQIISITSP